MSQSPDSAIYKLAKLSLSNTVLFKKEFPLVILSLRDLSDFSVAIHAIRKSHGGRAVKTAAGNWLAKNLTENLVMAYEKPENGYSIKDMLKIYHPRVGTKLKPVKDPLFDYILGKKVDLSKVKDLVRFDLLKSFSDSMGRKPFS
jgi:hypothetical protein